MSSIDAPRSADRRPLTGLIALIGLAAVALVLGLSLASDPSVADERVPGLGPQGRRPQFKVECGLSHSAPDDPIVHPGLPGASHLHDFFGSEIVDAHTTPGDLLGSATTCQQKLDTASYWAPALFDHGEKVDPLDLVAYYRPAYGADPATLVAYPHGLVMIAGDAHATEHQPMSVAAWHCGASPNLSPEPPVCPDTTPLAVRIAFPSCWDGVRLDSADHKEHLAYAVDGDCPDSHPVPVPELVVDIAYPITGEGHDLSIASGPTSTAHADFMNGWDQDKLEQEVRVCLNPGRICGIVSNRATD